MEKRWIRNETKADYRAVEELTRKAFWNLYVPGCVEHYVAHVLREHEDFIPELDFVMEVDGRIAGNIMYTKAKLVDDSHNEKGILTFGPVCILPELQRKGYGRQLIAHSFEKAAAMGYEVVVIFGMPSNYVGLGFKSCKKYNVCLEDGQFPASMLVKELKEGALDGRRWVYHGSPAYEVKEEQVQAFDAGFEPWRRDIKPARRTFIFTVIRLFCKLVWQRLFPHEVLKQPSKGILRLCSLRMRV